MTLSDYLSATLIAAAILGVAYHLPAAVARAGCVAAVGDAHCADPDTIATVRAAVDRLDLIASEGQR